MVDHKKDLLRICKKLIEAGLTSNKSKLEVAKNEVKFIGYKISYGKIELLLDKSQVLKDFPIPRVKTR